MLAHTEVHSVRALCAMGDSGCVSQKNRRISTSIVQDDFEGLKEAADAYRTSAVSVLLPRTWLETAISEARGRGQLSMHFS